MKNKLGDLVVKRRRSPGAKLVIAGVSVLVLLVAGGLLYTHGLSSAGFDRLSVARQQQELQEQIRGLKAENQELRDGLARAQLALQMDQTAYHELDKSLKGSAQEIVKLREELNFYRNIISPANKVAGLQIQRLDIARTESENQYHYKLVLVQSLRNEQTVTAQVTLEVRGDQEGKETLVRFPEPNERPIHVKFRYFQDVEGQLRLPKNFKPQRIKVHVAPGNADAVEQQYNWPNV